MKVLVGIDGSDGSFAAASQASRLLDPLKDSVVLYYSPPQVKAGGSHIDPKVLDKGREALADVVFNEALAHLPSGLKERTTTVIGTKPPRTGVVVAAEVARADMISVGARGIGPIERIVLGSTSQSVVQAARIPVLVARPPRASAAPNAPLRVLMACDGSDMDAQLADVVNSLTWAGGTVARVITVVESLYAGNVPDWIAHKARSPETEAIAEAFQREFESDKQKQNDRIKGFCQRLPAAFRCDPILVEGHAAEQILKQADAMQADLVILGARAVGPMARWFLGSTSEKVLNQAPCSVLLVRQYGQP